MAARRSRLSLTGCEAQLRSVATKAERGTDRHHAIDIVAVQRIDPQIEQSSDLALVLGIPTKTQHIEPVEERGEAAGPMLLSKVDGIDPGSSQFGSATLGTKLHRIQ